VLEQFELRDGRGTVHLPELEDGRTPNVSRDPLGGSTDVRVRDGLDDHRGTLPARRARTPAMAAGVAGHVWTLKDIAGLLD
jgi:hypothetical protein